MDSIEDNSVAQNTGAVNIETNINTDYYMHNEGVITMDGSIKNNNASIDTNVSYFEIPHQPSDQMLLGGNEISSDVSNIQKSEERNTSAENVNIFNNDSANLPSVEQMLDNSHTMPVVSSANTEIYMETNINGSEFPPSELQAKQDNISNDNIMHMSTSHYLDNQNQHGEIPVTTYAENNEVLMQENLLPNDTNQPVTDSSQTESSDFQNVVQSESVTHHEFELKDEEPVQTEVYPATNTMDTQNQPTEELLDEANVHIAVEQSVEPQAEELEAALQQADQDTIVTQPPEDVSPQVEATKIESGMPIDIAEEAQQDSSINIETTDTLIIEEVGSDTDYESIKADPLVILPEEQSLESSTEDGVEQTEVILVRNIEDVIVMETDEVIPDSQTEPEIIEITELEEDVAKVEGKTPPRKERSSTNVKSMKIPKIPHHVLGRNMENPVEDCFSNGRVPPKPRLGVKIPYRNLTSQMVSKQEIENVILERARLKNAAHDPPAGGDVFFTKKLTQRLAKKIAPSKSADESDRETEVENRALATAGSAPAKGSIKDNSDLIAILEGSEEEWSEPASMSNALRNKTPVISDEEKEREKQIALKQLEQLPQRRRGRSAAADTSKSKKPYVASPVKKDNVGVAQAQKPDTTHQQKSQSVQKVDSLQKASESPQKRHEEKPKEHHGNIKASTASQAKSDTTNKAVSAEKEEVDIEPRFVTSGVVKTYTRKRKPSEGVAALAKVVNADINTKKPLKSSNEQKVSIDLPPNAYVTKSSRIIKKKVIWDPDETALPFKSYKSPKVDGPVKSDKPVSPTKPLEKKSPKVIAKPLPVEEKAVQQKKIEKISSLKKPKRLTEVDKLLMDEGAVNMLYDVKNTEDQNQVNKQKKRKLSTISLDKAQKELESKTNEIKNDLQNSSTKESPKSLRKKENLILPSKGIKKEILPGGISRKKSKDSSRSSVHSPPASPGFAYSQHPEASRIIRRHSSSSFSSDGELVLKEARVEKEEKIEKETSKPEKVAKKKSTPNAVEQKSKKTRASVNKENLTVEVKNKLNEEMSKSFNKTTEATTSEQPVVESKYSEYKTISIKEHDKLVQIILNPGKKDALFTTEVLTELCAILNNLKQESSCTAVLVSSSGKSFCQGLDYKSLISDNSEVRKKKATQLANLVRDCLKTLATFPKFIAAGVDGNAVGIGVTMLPLFDMVLASDKATFRTPYAQLGCAAEGGVLLTLPNISSCNLASELLYASQKIVAGDAVKSGLVTRIIWSEKFQENMFNVVLPIANQSRQGIEAIKKQLRRSVLPKIEAALNAETDILMQRWTSSECQRNFGKYKVDKD